jgi:hypothetical protein
LAAAALLGGRLYAATTTGRRIVVVEIDQRSLHLPTAISARKQIRAASHLYCAGCPRGVAIDAAACLGGSHRALVRASPSSIPSSSIVSSCASIDTLVASLVTCAGKQSCRLRHHEKWRRSAEAM